jgi:osmoprotectant transport system permease protein
MTELNYQVDYLKRSPEQVAEDFLIRQHLYKAPQNGKKGTIRIGSKIFSEQYILSYMYSMLIKAYTQFDVVTKTGLGGTKICFDALMNDQIDLYPEYTGTALLVMLQPPKETVQEIIADKEKVYDFIKEAFDKKYNLTWMKPIGFNNTYALMMRRQEAEELDIHTISELSEFVKHK